LDQETENMLNLLYSQKLKGRKKRIRNRQEWVDAIVEIRMPRLMQLIATTHIEPAIEDTQQISLMQQPEEQEEEEQEEEEEEEQEEQEAEEQEAEIEETIATPSVTIPETVSTMSGRIIRPLHRFEPEISRRQTQTQTMEQRQRQRDSRGANAERQKKKPPITISQIRYRKGCEFYEEDCPICLDEKSYIATNCKHRFCTCIIKVVIQCRKEDRLVQCPYCREKVTRLQMIHPRFYKIVKNVLGTSKDIVCK